MLTSQQIIDEGLLKLDNTHGKPAQVGYDLTLKAVNILDSSEKIGRVLKDKTHLVEYKSYNTIKLDGVEGWLLYEGTYDVTFHEGCKIPNNRVGFIKQRSSLWRNGALINSPVFDPGFETDNMGTIMLVTKTIFIEKDARVAQMYFHECNSAEMYNGQWQNDVQRKNI